MFSASTRKKLLRLFHQPVRTRLLRKLVEELISDVRHTNGPKFIQALMDEGIVQLSHMKTRNGKVIPLYCSRSLDEVTIYELAAAMFPGGYFCNLSSIYYHSLTNQVPSVVYICNETISPRGKGVPETLSEAGICNAFIKPHRHTSNIVDFQDGEVIILDRVRGSDHGVMTVRKSRSLYPRGTKVTCVERALIDAVVAPQYNGGIVSLPAYFQAARKRLRVVKLLEIYRKLSFVYPYAQSIGFFLERVGLRKQAAEIRSAYPPRQQFYVDHSARTSWIYDERWMLHYPRGLVDED